MNKVMTTEQKIPMSLWLPDFNWEELEEILDMECIDYELINDKILITEVTPVYFEYLQSNHRNVLSIDKSVPNVDVAFAEGNVLVDIPECIQEDPNAAAAAAEAIEKELEDKIKQQDVIEDTDDKERLIENIYRVMHNHKFMSVTLENVILQDSRNKNVINSVKRVKGKVNQLLFNATCLEGKNQGRTMDVVSTNFIKVKEVTPAILKTILKQVNHCK